MKEKTEHYSADKPILNQAQDRFQRFEFSRRIAQTIKHRESNESIVFGLFGAWGEGKSSVINFINGELQKDESIITIHLNPWRYTDEESLLYNFFDRIANALDKDLNTRREKAAEFVQKYGGFSKFFGVDNSDISKAIADPKLEEFKARVDGFLAESSKRLVIFIDDIDRLDKQEISTLFKIIKLTADFSNTIYILSFDENMVAASIGERFGNGDIKAGENFLEKIIQVPLTIPKAQPEALKKFCFDLLNKAIETNEIDLTQEDASSFVYRFTTSVLSRLNTPRLAVRYSNTVSFSLPLLLGEVNTVDLMLIEALKIFYPDYYKFVKDYPDFFIGSYKSNSIYGGKGDNQTKIDLVKNHLEKLGESLKPKQKQDVEDLLVTLFPRFKGALDNLIYDRNHYEKWKKEKRVCSSAYFDRYFSYAVIEGDISDVEFEQFLSEIGSTETEEIISAIDELSAKSGMLKLIEKLQLNAGELEWEKFRKLAIAICQMSHKLDSHGSMFNLGMDSSLKQAAIFLYRHLEKNKERVDLFKTSNELLTNSTNIEFIEELIYWYNKEGQEDRLFSSKEYKIFNKTLVEKALSTLQENENLITKFPEQNRFLLKTWHSLSKNHVKQYVSKFLNEDEKNAIAFLWVFTPLIRSTAQPKPYKGDLSLEAFQEISNYVGHKTLKNRLLKLYKKDELTKEEPFWDDRRNSLNNELNLTRQFLHRERLDSVSSMINLNA